MVRTKDKKAKGDSAFTKTKQKVGAKKLAPATATKAEIHARTLRILKPRDEVITPDTITKKKDANDFLTSKAEAAQRVTSQVAGSGWEKHRPDRTLHENLLGAAHYREATRASSFTALNTTVDHFASAISPTQFMQLLNVTLGAVTDTGADVREKALALFMKLLKMFPPPMTSDGVRHIMTYIRISLTHAQAGVRRSGIKMLGAFARQWPGAIRKAYADVTAATASGGAAAAAAAASASGAAALSSAAVVTESTIAGALASGYSFVTLGAEGSNVAHLLAIGNTAAAGASAASSGGVAGGGPSASVFSFLKSSEVLAQQGGVLNGTAGGPATVGSGATTYIADSNNKKGNSGVEIASIYDTTVRARTFDIEQILEWATDVAASAPVNQQHRMMPVIATLLEEVLPYRAHAAADQSADMGGAGGDIGDGDDGSGDASANATVTLPVAFVERYLKKFAGRWAMQWKELMELGYKMFRDAIVVERITAVGRCFAACTIYLHRHGRLFTSHGYGRMRDGASGAASGDTVDFRWMLRELFLHKVPFTMKELTTGSGSRMGGEEAAAAGPQRMTTQEALLRGPLMDPKQARKLKDRSLEPSLSRAAKKITAKGPRHLSILPTAKSGGGDAAKRSAGDASQLTVFDAFAAVANVSTSRLRIAEVIAWCLLPIASDKQECARCDAVVAGGGVDAASAAAGAAVSGDVKKGGKKRGRAEGSAKGGAKSKQVRTEGSNISETKAAEGEEGAAAEGDGEEDDEIDEVALGKPDLEADEKDADEEVDLDARDEARAAAAAAVAKGASASSAAEAAAAAANDNVSQAKRIVKTFIESPASPLTSAVQVLRALLFMYPHLYPSLGMPLLEALLKRAQAAVASVTPITIAAPARPLSVGGLAKDKDAASSADSGSGSGGGDEGESSKLAKERNASAAFGSQSGRDLRDLVGLLGAAMTNKYLLSWPAPAQKKRNTASSGKAPVEALGDLLRDQIPKTLFSLRNFAAHPSVLPPAHSNAYNNAARRQIAMAHERSATLGVIMRAAVHTYHDAVTMRHPALYHCAAATTATAAGPSSASADAEATADAALRKALSALVEVRIKRPASADGEAAPDEIVINGPLRSLDDPVLLNTAKGTLSYL